MLPTVLPVIAIQLPLLIGMLPIVRLPIAAHLARPTCQAGLVVVPSAIRNNLCIIDVHATVGACSHAVPVAFAVAAVW